jgi:hypothetical protein
MRSRPIAAALLMPALALSACGSKSTTVDTTAYTCGKFSTSLASKGDDTAGAFINALRKEANLGQDQKTERREITLGIYFACRGKPRTTKPADSAIKTAQQIKAGKFKLPSASGSKKKSAK